MTVTRIKTSTGWFDLQQGPAGPPGPGGGVTGNTSDTFEPYKVIMLSNGTVRAIPVGAAPPTIPTGFAVDVRLSSVRAHWTAGVGATQYMVYRTGMSPVTVSTLYYRDLNIVVGSTYQYWVQSIDTYGQRSAVVGPISAFVDPADNSDPEASIKTWPATLSTVGQTLIRVNARDVDAQVLETELEVDDGTITPTDDPSVWVYTP
jgi:hypothetical protein